MKTIRAFDEVINVKKQPSRKNRFNSIDVYLEKQIESLRKDRNFYRALHFFFSFIVLMANISVISISITLIVLAIVNDVQKLILIVSSAIITLLSVIAYVTFSVYSRNTKLKKYNEAYKLVQFLYLEHKFSRDPLKNEVWLIERIEVVTKYIRDENNSKKSYKEIIRVFMGDNDEQ
jgi:hypothetical protein